MRKFLTVSDYFYIRYGRAVDNRPKRDGNRRVDLVNQRLERLGRQNFRIVHRERPDVSGILQLVDAYPYDAFFYCCKYRKFMSVADYFYIRYGRSVDDRKRVVYLRYCVDDSGEIEDDCLFPMECFLVVQ
ncbi:unnamed protein product [Caenorhabditis nigoni]